MRRFIGYLLITALLCSCAAEKRLAHLLAMHPELQRTDTLYKDRVIYLPDEQNTTTITLDELQQLDRQATDSTNHQEENRTPDIQVSTTHSQATIKALGNGKLALQTKTPPDTIHLIDTVYQPQFITRTQYKDKIVHQLTPFQAFLCYTGAIALILLLLRIIINAIRR